MLKTFPPYEELRELIQLAKREDLGSGDITSRLLVEENQIGVGTLIQKEVGIPCGLPMVEMICRTYDERLRVEQIPGFHMEVIEGRFSDARETPLLRLRGPMRSLLSAERVILNFLQHLSGVATHTHRFVRRIAGTQARIFDTRKTVPGMRLLDKYAVRCGGGHNHRVGLFDGVLIKDNHLSALGHGRKEIRTAVEAARGLHGAAVPVEIEVDNLAELDEALRCGPDIVLLDNMPPEAMREAVRRRDAVAPRVLLEASGGVTLATVRAIAETGVDRVSVGALTHSAPALDIALDYLL